MVQVSSFSCPAHLRMTAICQAMKNHPRNLALQTAAHFALSAFVRGKNRELFRPLLLKEGALELASIARANFSSNRSPAGSKLLVKVESLVGVAKSSAAKFSY